MRVGHIKTQSQINQLKGVDNGIVRRTQRWKKEVTLKQEVKEKEVQDGELGNPNG